MTMTLKALFYKCYARRGILGVESKGQGARATLEFFRQFGPSLGTWI